MLDSSVASTADEENDLNNGNFDLLVGDESVPGGRGRPLACGANNWGPVAGGFGRGLYEAPSLMSIRSCLASSGTGAPIESLGPGSACGDNSNSLASFVQHSQSQPHLSHPLQHQPRQQQQQVLKLVQKGLSSEKALLLARYQNGTMSSSVDRLTTTTPSNSGGGGPGNSGGLLTFHEKVKNSVAIVGGGTDSKTQNSTVIIDQEAYANTSKSFGLRQVPGVGMAKVAVSTRVQEGRVFSPVCFFGTFVGLSLLSFGLCCPGLGGCRLP